MKDNRYQHQNWFVKLWRRRYYILIPWYAFYLWRGIETKHFSRKTCWSLARGIVCGKMKWTYTSEEVMAALDKTSKRREY